MKDINPSDIRILYMEDDPGLARILTKRLSRLGFNIEIAENGAQGICMVGEGSYDVLLVDQNMPEMTGLEVVRQLATTFEAPPIIMVTGNGNEAIAVEALKEGAADYLVKDSELGYLELLPGVISKVFRNYRLELERREMEGKYRKLVDLSPDGLVLARENIIEFINPAGLIILGVPNETSIIGESFIELLDPDCIEDFQIKTRQMEKDGDILTGVVQRMVRKDGKTIPVEISAVLFIHQGEKTIQYLFRDITDRLLAQQHLEKLAHYDSLTGLPNRALFSNRLNQLLMRSKSGGVQFALLFVDLDKFKQVNDGLGHEAGDIVLQTVAHRMTDIVRGSDTVTRLGGDEFVILLANIDNPRNAGIVADKIIQAVRQPIYVPDTECLIDASVGIAIYPQDGESSEDLLRNADQAMYSVKEAGRGDYKYFSVA